MVQREREEDPMNSWLSFLRYLNSRCPSSPVNHVDVVIFKQKNGDW